MSVLPLSPYATTTNVYNVYNNIDLMMYATEEMYRIAICSTIIY